MVQIKQSILVILMLISIISCRSAKENILPSNGNSENEYLVAWEKGSAILKNQLITYWGNNDTANAFIQYDVSVYSITYNSIDKNGNTKLLSGAILVPNNSMEKSVISIQHATFFADSEAPSVNDGFSVVSRKSIFAAHGYIVFLPDYYGYGVDRNTIHPYHHAESLRIASRDMILASYEFLKEQQIQFNQKLFLAGYSEGAFATAALQQLLESDQKLPVSLTASSLGSGAYNMKATFEYFTADINQPPGCTPCNAFLLQAYNEVYDIGYEMDTYFQVPFNQKIAEGLFLGDFDAAEIATTLPDNPTQLYQPTFITHYYQGKASSWEMALSENSIHEWQPQQPTLLTHNQQDNVAPFFNSVDLADYNATNNNLTFLPIEGTDHFSGIFNWGILTMDYFDRF